MSGFQVVSSNQLLTALWDLSSVEVTGELIFNDTSAKTYFTIQLDANAFQSGQKDQSVVNGVSYIVRLITYNSNGDIVRNIAKAGSGKTVPGVVNFDVEVRNKALAINLTNYNPAAALVNGYAPIIGFEVFIDAADNEDHILKFPISKLVNNQKLIINDMNDVNALSGNLENGINYEIVVRAVNAMGKGVFGTPQNGVPSSQTPGIPSLTGVEKNLSVELSWGLPSADYAFTYTIRHRVTGTTAWTVINNVSKTVPVYDGSSVFIRDDPRAGYTVGGLVNGTAYDFSVSVVSAEFGMSIDRLLPNKTPYTVPGVMSLANVEITDLSNSSIRVKLTPPAINGGKAVTQFHFANPNALNTNLAAALDASGHSIFIVGPLTNGVAVAFQAKSKNDDTNNWSPVLTVNYTQYANPTSAVTMLAPVNATSNGAAIENGGMVNLSWTLPTSSNLGGAVASDFTHTIEHNKYYYDISAGYVADPSNAFVGVTNALTRQITGLTLGKEYTFKIKSKFNKNSVDFVSPESSSVTIIPHSIPNAPAPTIDMSGVDMRIMWAEPNLYNLALRKYEYAIKLASSQAQLVYYTANSAREQLIQPTQYGQLHQLYMKTYTILPGSSDLVSAVSCVVEYTPYKAPSAVRDFALYPLDGAMEVRWAEPENKGGYSSLKYRVAVNGSLRETVSVTRTEITGLSGSETYIGVVPVGVIGNAEYLAGPATYNYAYPYSDPEPPTGLSLTPGDNKIKLQWVASATSASNVSEGSEPPVISYIIFRNDVKLSNVDVSNGVVEYQDTTVINGTSYSYRVISKQTFAGGKVTYSDNFTEPADLKSATPFKNPEPPRNLVLVSEDRQIRASWDAPLNLNGLSSPDYKIEVRDASNVLVFENTQTGLNITIDASNVTLTNGLTNGQQYNVKVWSRGYNMEANVVGWYVSLSNLSGNVTPNVAPNAPTNVSVEAGDKKATLRWDQANVDSYQTTGYRVYKDGVKIADLTDRYAVSHVIDTPELVNGTPYVFSVSRMISELSGAESSKVPAPSVVPFGKPSTLTATRTSDKKQVSVTVNRNGSSITDFIVFVVPKTYASSNVLIDTSSPLSPADLLVTGNFTRTTSLNVDEVAAAYVIVSNAAGMSVLTVDFSSA